MKDTYDLIVVGGGIVGLGHAYAAAVRGESVVVLERGPRASGASVRNFGMVWPVGQPAGPDRRRALRSREIWLELFNRAGVNVRPCGSIFVAHFEDEHDVLEEFVWSSASEGLSVELLTSSQILEAIPGVNPNGLRGGMRSGSELGVDPPQAIAQLTAYLHSELNVHFQFETEVVDVASGRVETTDNAIFYGDRVVVACGASLQTLFSAAHRAENLRVCKLQMMKTRPQTSWNLGAHLASGLTLRHYHSFDSCPSIPRIRERIAATMPELDTFGIHVMASQTSAGELILGDSHQYGNDVDPFNQELIDDLVLRELRKILNAENYDITHRWSGVYVSHPERMFFVREVLPDVMLVNGFGGNGMTLSLAAAEEVIDQWSNAITDAPSASAVNGKHKV